VGDRPLVDSETENVRNEMEIGLCDGGIDLEVNPPFFQHIDSRSDPSNEPLTFRNASCVFASGPSRLMLTR